MSIIIDPRRRVFVRPQYIEEIMPGPSPAEPTYKPKFRPNQMSPKHKKRLARQEKRKWNEIRQNEKMEKISS